MTGGSRPTLDGTLTAEQQAAIAWVDQLVHDLILRSGGARLPKRSTGYSRVIEWLEQRQAFEESGS